MTMFDNNFGFKVFLLMVSFAIVGGLVVGNDKAKAGAEEMELPLSVTDLENDEDTLKVLCKDPHGVVEIHYTTKENPLYRGGWDFYNIKGQRVMSNDCHCVHKYK